MKDEWMFEVPGAIGARLERDPDVGVEGSLVLIFEVPPATKGSPPVVLGEAIGASPDLPGGVSDEDAADIVEERLGRHYDAKRIDDPKPGVICEWALSQRTASPGMDQPIT